jgi:hypothetical protein
VSWLFDFDPLSLPLALVITNVLSSRIVAFYP